MKSKLILFFFFLSFCVFGQKEMYRESQTDTVCSIDSVSLSHCSCADFIIISPPKVRGENDPIVFDGPGSCWTSALYNKDKIIKKCGFFNKQELIYGLNFIYDRRGKLSEIEQYYKGQKIGSCKM